jgi:outer membrane immunogenic protein
MNKFALAALALLAPAFASAADLPARKAAVAPVPSLATMTWNGYYIGFQGGWQQLRNNYSDLGINANLGNDSFGKQGQNSFVGGAKVGYDFAMGRAVYGAVADIDFGTSKLTWRDPADWGYDQKIRIQGSLRARAGMTFGNALVYSTGGLAVADIQTVYCECGSYESFSNTKFGWTLGAGAEYALTKNWSTMIEYRYSDFGKVSHIPVNVWQNYLDSQTVKTNTVRFGVNYRFGN